MTAQTTGVDVTTARALLATNPDTLVVDVRTPAEFDTAHIVVSGWLPATRYLAGLLGAGLAFAALSNTCLLGRLLSRLRYHQGPGCDVDAAIARLRGPVAPA